MAIQPLGRNGQVLAAAAQIMNNEAGVLMNYETEAEVKESASRLAHYARVLLHYVERHGVRASRDSIEELTDQANDPR